MPNLTKEVVSYTKDTLTKELKKLDSQLKIIADLKERKIVVEELQNQSKKILGSDEVKKYTVSCIEDELKSIDKKLKMEEDVKTKKDTLVTINNMVPKSK